MKEAIKQMQARTNMEINLTYNIDSIPLTPNEEIHLMQIAKEAIQNAMSHSKGTKVKVQVFNDENAKVHLKVTDNGVGIPDDPTKLNHYGLAIMQERSQSLKGQLSIERAPLGGTEVSFEFMPEYMSVKV